MTGLTGPCLPWVGEIWMDHAQKTTTSQGSKRKNQHTVDTCSILTKEGAESSVKAPSSGSQHQDERKQATSPAHCFLLIYLVARRWRSEEVKVRSDKEIKSQVK